MTMMSSTSGNLGAIVTQIQTVDAPGHKAFVVSVPSDPWLTSSLRLLGTNLDRVEN
jgi:hypothetical protein